MKREPEKTVGVYERPEKKASGLKIVVAAVLILLAVLAVMFLIRAEAAAALSFDAGRLAPPVSPSSRGGRRRAGAPAAPCGAGGG